MRAILILVCLLNQFALVECGATINHQECSKDYTCYAPQRCFDGSSALSNGDFDVMTKNTYIHDNCAAIFGYHAFTEYWVHVLIESFDTKIKTVVFLTTVGSDNKATREFSCSFNGISSIGKFRRAEDDSDKKNKVQESASDKLKCSFFVKLAGNDYALTKDPNSWDAQFKITNDQNTEESTLVKTLISLEMRCSPKNVHYNQESAHSTKKYAKILFEPGHYHCEEPNLYKLEYRKQGTSDYKEILTFGCETKRFTIDGEKIPDATVEVRCFSKTEFMCKYAPTALLTTSDVNKQLQLTNSDSVLKCPEGFPYIVTSVNGMPIKDPKFECLNHGGGVYWTLDGIPYKNNGRKASCTNEIKCLLMRKISMPENGGSLDSIGFPKCPERSTLRVKVKNGDGNYGEFEKVTDKRCHTLSGIFKYQVEGSTTEKDVDDNTAFDCQHPKIFNTDTEKQRGDIVSGAGVGILVFGIILGIAIIVAGFLVSRRAIRKRKLAALALADLLKKDDALWNQHCMTDEEKDAYAKKKEAMKEKNEVPPASVPCEDPSKLSVQIMSKVFAAQKRVKAPGTINFRPLAKPEPKECNFDESGRDSGLVEREPLLYDPVPAPALNFQYYDETWYTFTDKVENEKKKRQLPEEEMMKIIK